MFKKCFYLSVLAFLLGKFVQAQEPRLVKDINPSGNSTPTGMTTLDGQLYFVAENGSSSSGRELFVSDGTKAGTKLVKDLDPSRTGADNNLKVYNNKVFLLPGTVQVGLNYLFPMEQLPGPN